MINFPAQRTSRERVPFTDVAPSAHARATRARALESGWVTDGPEVAAFEQEFATHVGAAYAVALSSAATALELSLASLRLAPETGVLVSTGVSSAVLLAIVRAGLRPELMDVSATTGRPTPRTARDAATRLRAHGTPLGALVADHWTGDPADAESLAAAVDLSPERILQEASHALGTEQGGTTVGARGTVCFSFYATTNLPIGEGGMVTTDDPERAAHIRAARSRTSFRSLPDGALAARGAVGAGPRPGMTDLSAAIGRGQLALVTEWQRRRDRLAALYDSRLAEIEGIRVPHRPTAESGRHSWHLYAVQVDHPRVDRDVVVRALDAAGIDTGGRCLPLHRLSHTRRFVEVPAEGLPEADRLAADLVLLPMYPRLSAAAVGRVGAVLDGLLSGHRGGPAARPV